MTELAPCPSCKRHVAVHETRCPFCAVAISGLRAMHRVPGRLARAAVFTAALAACSDPKPAGPPPATGSAQGSDDLEELLDHGTPVEHAMPSDAAVADAIVDAAVDAGVPVDAGLSQEERDAREGRREAWRRQKRKEMEERKKRLDHLNAKPYGAPPARRRVV